MSDQLSATVNSTETEQSETTLAPSTDSPVHPSAVVSPGNDEAPGAPHVAGDPIRDENLLDSPRRRQTQSTVHGTVDEENVTDDTTRQSISTSHGSPAPVSEPPSSTTTRTQDEVRQERVEEEDEPPSQSPPGVLYAPPQSQPQQPPLSSPQQPQLPVRPPQTQQAAGAPPTPTRPPPKSQQQGTPQQQQPVSVPGQQQLPAAQEQLQAPPAANPGVINTAPIPYVPSAILTAPVASTGGDSSFWDLFSSSAPQAKLSKDLVDWAPDLAVQPPSLTMPADWTKAALNLAEQDRLTGHIPPYALRFGFVDELGDFHPMLDWGDGPSGSGMGGSGMGGGRQRRENKHTARAKEAAKDILSSIQHHRLGGAGTRGTRAGSIGVGQTVLPNGKVGLHPQQPQQGGQPAGGQVQQGQPPPSPAHVVAGQPGLSVTVPPTPNAAQAPALFSPPPSLPNSQNAATHAVFPRADLPDTNWWNLSTGDGI